jgi:hypothetical protein
MTDTSSILKIVENTTFVQSNKQNDAITILDILIICSKAAILGSWGWGMVFFPFIANRMRSNILDNCLHIYKTKNNNLCQLEKRIIATFL